MKFWRLIGMWLLAVVLVTACGTTEDGQSNENESGMEEQGSGADDQNGEQDEATSEEPATEQMTGEGTYNGQADPHTIEIELEDGPQAFQITEELKDTVANLKEGTEITFIYEEEEGTYYIKSIQEK
ncbi:hypothetical protein [Pseudalkalibacillus sp. SCS-8]|uniref:hypothetical protein n=1 Tax=Pseudalkalibacillus nanhaiensis TaxID=3115291 RepID=UPI0032D9D097